MEKEKLIKKIDIFMNQAFQANCYYSIIGQFTESRHKYHEELSLSSAFYSYTYNALVIATFMELSKIYDSHKCSMNIEELVKECKENISYFPTIRTKKVEIDGETQELTFPFRHTVTDEEIEFFQAEVEQEKEFRKLLNLKDSPIQVEMTVDRYFELYEWRLKRIEPQVYNLLRQRNKVYAHNDEATMKADLDEVTNKFSLNNKEIKTLISFALDFCRFAYAMLTDINRAVAPVNIDDWQNTLDLVRIGEKYKEIEIERGTKELSDKY